MLFAWNWIRLWRREVGFSSTLEDDKHLEAAVFTQGVERLPSVTAALRDVDSPPSSTPARFCAILLDLVRSSGQWFHLQ